MRILYFADIRFPLERANGIQTMETCCALAERGHDVDLIVRPDTHAPARDPFEYYGRPRLSRLHVERVPVTGPSLPTVARRVGYLAYAASRATGSSRADVIMTRDLAVASMLLYLPSRAPLVYESHGYAPDVAAALPAMVSTAKTPPPSKLARLARRELRVWKGTEGYVTITEHLRAELIERFGPRERIAVVPDGARLPAGRSPVQQTSNGNLVGYAGHLYAWKGVDGLVEALARVPEARGLIVGGHSKEPDLERLKRLAVRLGMKDRVTFTGMVPPAGVAPMLEGVDILVLPNPASAISTHATSPLKLFEYMAAGRSILASDLPAIREVLTHDVNAWLVPAGDAHALAEGIRRLIGDAALRSRLADRALATVADYSWERRAERLETLFTAVLATSR